MPAAPTHLSAVYLPVASPPGSKAQETGEGDKIEVTLPDGNTVVVPPGAKVEDAGAKIEVTLPDGDKVVVPPGAQVEDAGANIEVTLPDGGTVVVPPGAQVEDAGDKIEVTLPGGGTVVVPSGAQVEAEGTDVRVVLPGPDATLGTGDDVTILAPPGAQVEAEGSQAKVTLPGPDGALGTGDDLPVIVPSETQVEASGNNVKVTLPGPDLIPGTGDDVVVTVPPGAKVEAEGSQAKVTIPGPDGVLGTGDDIVVVVPSGSSVSSNGKVTRPSSGGRSGGGGSGSGLQPPAPPAPPPVTISKANLSYIGGANRVLTAVAISRQGWTSAHTVILVSGEAGHLIDALTAAPLAGQEDAPILLNIGELDPAVAAEIQRLGASKVYTIGALSDAVVAALKAALPDLTVETLRGANRFETAALVSAKVENPQGTFIVGYDALADAVSAASYAAAHGYLIRIAHPDGTLATDHYPLTTDHQPDGTPATDHYPLPTDHQPDGTPATDHYPLPTDHYILGGPTLVGDVAGATRLYGADRYETNKAIRAALPFEYANIYTADGDTLVDALTGSVIAAKTKAAIVLTPGNDPTGVDFGGITAETKVYAFGGGK
jgi:hypothetical protein